MLPKNAVVGRHGYVLAIFNYLNVQKAIVVLFRGHNTNPYTKKRILYQLKDLTIQ